MEHTNGYKYATIVLVLIVIVLGVLLYMQSRPQAASEALHSVSDQVKDCRTAITAWQNAHADAGTTTEAQAQLKTVLADCSDAIGNAE